MYGKEYTGTGVYIPNLFDYKPSKYHLDSKNSKKPENLENVGSGSEIQIQKFWEFFFENLFFFNCEHFLLNEFFAKMVFSSKSTIYEVGFLQFSHTAQPSTK